MDRKYKFLYLDDEGGDTISAYIDELKSGDHIEVTHQAPRDFEGLADTLIQKSEEYDGFIFDLQISEHAQSDDEGNTVNITFNAPTMAQHLRTKATEKIHKHNGKIVDRPIVLTSTDEKLKESYTNDRTSHDLFDYKFLKREVPQKGADIAVKLKALAKGYQTIMKVSGESDRLSLIIGRNISEIDNRILARFVNETDYPAHEIARHILKELIGRPGPLVNEYVLAARFGLSLNSILRDEEKKREWDTIKAEFSESKYSGVFCEGWSSWWWDRVKSVFHAKFNKRLSYISSDEIVQIFKENYQLENIQLAAPINRNSSQDFSTVCQGLLEPLDQLEGFRVDSKREPLGWQEYEYVSLEFLMGPDVNISIHPSEKERFDQVSSAR